MQAKMNPYGKVSTAYKQSKVTTNDPITLVVLLYDGAIRFLKLAERALYKQDYEQVNGNLIKAKDIISELLMSINTDMQSELVENLKSLYNYMYDRLIDANVGKSVEATQEVRKLLEDVREAWSVLLKQKNHSEITNEEVKRASITLKG